MGATGRRAMWAVLVVAAAVVVATQAVALGTRTSSSASAFEQPGVRDLIGDLDGAAYRIRVPARWNGTLLVFAHGYVGAGSDPAGTEVLVPRAGDEVALLADGYALAGTAYRHDGWALDVGPDDLAALAEHFASTVARPARTLAWGQSMGGLVVTAALEAHPGTFDGALSLCGVIGGATAWWDVTGLAFARAYDAAFGWPADWGTAEAPRPDLDFDRDVSPVVLAQLAAPAERPAWEFVRRVVGAPEADFYGGGAWLAMGLATAGRADLVARAGGQPLGLPVDGYRLDADDTAALAFVGFDPQPRLDHMTAAAASAPPPDPAARAWLAAHADPSGALEVPLLAVHTEADTFVPAGNLAAYTARVAARGDLDDLVTTTVARSGHCSFESAERIGAVELLDRWVAGGGRPSAAEVADLAE
jgi:alpha-beta hydrolase superfamily lysophospholipase